MSVPAWKRKPSEFKVHSQLTKMRKEVTDLALRDFGWRKDKEAKRIERLFNNRKFEQLNPEEQERYTKLQERNEAFAEWFIKDEREYIIHDIRTLDTEVSLANNIYPQYIEELIERRKHQDLAIGYCTDLVQELQYINETLPIDNNKYHTLIDMVNEEVLLLKGWRKSDNKLKTRLHLEEDKEKITSLLTEIISLLQLRAPSDSAANFANVNNNGNANYNSASNANGVRPDFDPQLEKPVCVAGVEKGE